MSKNILHKVIGVVVDENLQWREHVNGVFKKVCQSNSRQTCKNDLYLPPRAKLNVYRNTLRYSGALIWNDLPANEKTCRPTINV